MDRTNEPLVAAFAEALRNARQSVGMTQEELAGHADVSVRFISLLETGKRQPSLSALAAVSAGLGMTMSALLEPVEQRLWGISQQREVAEKSQVRLDHSGR